MEKASAVNRAEELLARGMPSRWVSQTCIAENRSGWLVWLGELYPTEAAANKAAENFSKAFQRYDLKNGRFWVRKLR